MTGGMAPQATAGTLLSPDPESPTAADRSTPRSASWSSKSRQISQPTFANFFVYFGKHSIEAAGRRIGGDLLVPPVILPAVHPARQLRPLLQREPHDSRLDLIQGRHADSLATVRGSTKSLSRRLPKPPPIPADNPSGRTSRIALAITHHFPRRRPCPAYRSVNYSCSRACSPTSRSPTSS